jgi:ribosomal protein S11
MFFLLKQNKNLLNSRLSFKNTFMQTSTYNSTVNNSNKNNSKLNLVLINPKINSMKFYFNLYNLLYWPSNYGYQLPNLNFLDKKLAHEDILNNRLNYKSEMLLRFGSRNAQVIIHMPRVPELVYKKYFVHREAARSWNKNNSSNMLFGFSAGRCGFKPNETKSFIANDTLVRAGLWFITRFVKKLSPIKLRLMGNTATFRKYLYRLTPKRKKLFKYKIACIDDATPIPFNGCKLSHYPRKRFRYHTPNFRRVLRYVKNYKMLKVK